MRQIWRKKKGETVGPIRFQCAGDWISTGLPRTDIYTSEHT